MKYVIVKKDQAVFPRIYTDLEEAQRQADIMSQTFETEYVVLKLKQVK